MYLCIANVTFNIAISLKSYHIRMHVHLQVGSTETSIPVISDVSSIHDLSKQVPQIFPWDLGICFQVVVEDVHTDGQITCVVWVHPVPALRTKLSPFTDDCMEVAQGKQNGLELSFTCTHLQRILGEVVKSFMQIGMHACGRLICYLDSCFQDTLGDDVGLGGTRGFSTDEYPVVLMSITAVLLQLFLQTGKPFCHKMDILQQRQRMFYWNATFLFIYVR